MPESNARKPTPAELELLRTLWKLGPATVKDVHQAMQSERPSLTYANVLRLMQVMHDTKVEYVVKNETDDDPDLAQLSQEDPDEVNE